MISSNIYNENSTSQYGKFLLTKKMDFVEFCCGALASLVIKKNPSTLEFQQLANWPVAQA